MKYLLASCVLLIGACVSPSGTVPLTGGDSPLGRQVERVVDRHNVYVEADVTLGQAEKDLAVGEGLFALGVVGQPQVDPVSLAQPLRPVLDRHDGYVERDESIDELTRETFLATSETLRELLTTAGAK